MLVTLVVAPVSAARVRLIVAPPAMAVAPVEPETVKLEVSTAIPPSKLTRVVVVAPRPVTVARVSASDVKALEGMVIVEPEVETEEDTDPVIVIDPATSL